ncbi:MAG: ATP-binding protein [Candidatus Delongbacteria bacterium]
MPLSPEGPALPGCETVPAPRGEPDPRQLERRLEELTRELEIKDRLLTGNLLQMERVAGKLRQILASMSSAVLMVELDGYLSEANPRARTLLNIEGELPILASAVLPEPLQNILDEVVGEGRHVSQDELLLEGRHGVQTLRVDCRLVRDDMGNPIGVLQILDDQTHLIHMERRLEQSRTLAALGEMAASVAHELRNPLGGIGGFAALLKDLLEPESDPHRYTLRIIEGVEGLNKVATNLLTYTRPVEPRLQVLDLRQLLREVLSFIQIEVEQARLPLELEIDLGLTELPVRMDPELMRQSFLNLFKNAVQAFEGGPGRLGCRVRETRAPGGAGRIAVEVWDTGPGIPENLHEKLYNPFFTTRAKGTGLGLAIVRKNVELHGGVISLRSKPGQGACFTVQLPLANEL